MAEQEKFGLALKLFIAFFLLTFVIIFAEVFSYLNQNSLFIITLKGMPSTSLILLIEFIPEIITLVFGILVILTLFKKSKKFSIYTIFYLWLFAISFSSMGILSLSIGKDILSSLGFILTFGVIATLLTYYVIRSRKVKTLFVN